MKVTHDWKAKSSSKQKEPDYIDYKLHMAEVQKAKDEAIGFALRLNTEFSLLALNEEFGFGKERLSRYLDALKIEQAHFAELVAEETQAEQGHLKPKDRSNEDLDLDYTWQQHQDRLNRIYPV